MSLTALLATLSLTPSFLGNVLGQLCKMVACVPAPLPALQPHSSPARSQQPVKWSCTPLGQSAKASAAIKSWQALYLAKQWLTVHSLQVEHFRVKKQATMVEFKQMVADKWQIPVEQQRYWFWATRQNASVRVATPLGPEFDSTKVCEVRVCLASLQSLPSAFHPFHTLSCYLVACQYMRASASILCSCHRCGSHVPFHLPLCLSVCHFPSSSFFLSVFTIRHFFGLLAVHQSSLADCC